jgi:hypothetical protein
MGEYVPSAPVNEEARKRNGNLPGMGGVFNYVNLHVYHYAGNNPVKLVDPDGKWTFSLGLSGSACAGAGVQGSVGIAFGHSKGKGFSLGIYVSGGIQFGIPPSAGLGLTGSFSLKTESVSDLDGFSSSTGVSIPIGGIDIATKDGIFDFDPASGVSVSIGIKGSPTVVEGHTSIDGTKTGSTSVPEIIQGMEEIKQKFDDWVVEKILESVPLL